MIVLASASPRRAQLLQQIGVQHRVMPAQLEERRLGGESVEQCVRRLAESKALQVQARLAEACPVLGADTVVVLDGELLGKPADRAEGLAMLARLSGRTHEVLSAVALASAERVRCCVARSEVRFRALSAQECAAYWDSGEPCDKAGGYAIQGLAAVFVAELRGSFSAVVGLPLFETAELLTQAGVPIWRR